MADQAKTTEDTQDTTPKEAETQDTAEKQEKTFTQAELDKVIADRLARERAKMPSAEKLKAFDEWEKAQKTEVEKQAEREAELAKVKTDNETLRRENLAYKAGVNADDLEFVVWKVGRMEGDFEANLKGFLEENKKYTEPETKTVEGTKHTPSTPETMSGVEKAFMKRNPGLKVD